MEGINLHLPSVIPDSYYDISTHNAAYHPCINATNSSWTSREDRVRAYQPLNNEFQPETRYPTGNTGRHGCQLESVDQVNHGDDRNPNTLQEDWHEEERKDDDEKVTEKSAPRQSQVAVTLQWLSENYEKADGVCLPRCVLYQHYLDFCKKMKFTPAGAATFGKIIRQRFPKLTTRRLGTRGQSKYHYYGIGIKETSIYYHSVYSGKGLTRFSGIKLKTEGSSRKYSLSSKTGTLLPDFPNAKNLILPAGTDLEKMRTFIMMYRTHCQRILDTIISANFDEVQNFLVHFWQGMPEHLVDLLHCEVIADIISLCDSILYKVLVDVLIPSSIQEIPQSLYGDMRMFTKFLPYWLETSMETVPAHIQLRKLEVAKSFIQSLKRQSSFVLLAQTARVVIMNQDIVTQMVKDISSVDFEDICSQAGFMEHSANPKFCMKMQDFYDELKELLSKQSCIENYTEWIDDIVEKCVIKYLIKAQKALNLFGSQNVRNVKYCCVRLLFKAASTPRQTSYMSHLDKPSDSDQEVFKDKAAEFLLHWGAFGGLLMRELTLQNATSFASIHLVHLMLDEYAFLVIETQQEAEVEKLLQTAVQRHMKNAEEIQTKAVVRNASNKGTQSPKCKKKRCFDEIDQDNSSQASNTRLHSTAELSTIVNDQLNNGTAFTRPLPTNSKNIQNSETSSENSPSQRIQTGTISVPPVKPYQPYNNTFDRPTYLPQFGIGSYTDYVGVNPPTPFTNARFSNYSETYNQGFPATHFGSNISPVGGNYWTDGRSHHTLSDPYQSYNYNKLNATYDSLNKTTLLRNNAYQETINRQGFDSARSYYRSAHENIQVGPQLQMGAYGTNFMDIAPPAGQYCYQDEIFPASMATSFGKTFLSGPFR